MHKWNKKYASRHTHDINVVMPMYNLMECSDTYWKTSGSLWQYYRDGPSLKMLKFKQQITGQTLNNETKDVEIMGPLKYLSNFWRTLEMSLIHCEISFTLPWSKSSFLVAETAANQEPIFTITDTKLYIPASNTTN